MNSAANIVTRNFSVSPCDKFQSDKNNKSSKISLAQELTTYKIGSEF